MTSGGRERSRLSASLLGDASPRIPLPDRPLRRLPRPAALLVLLLLILALAWSAFPAEPRLPEAPAANAGAQERAPIGDLALYAGIVARVAGGEAYYRAALAEQRAHDYPTQPFITVRPPTLAWIDARLGLDIARLALIAGLLATLLAWHRVLGAMVSPPERILAALLGLAAGFGLLEPRAALLHEAVAGLLLSLSLALYRPHREWAALLALAAALAVRELALPFALLWLAFALAERRPREARALLGLLALFAAGLVLHYLAIEALRLPDDRASPGWGALAGPRLAIDGVVRFTPLVFLPSPVAGPLALLPLLGWIGLGGRLGLFAALWFAGMALVIAVLAREANFYWALMLLPAYGIGLALVPRALLDLGRAALALRCVPG